MFFFSLNLYFWFDRVCIIKNFKEKLKPWDLIKIEGSFFIYLWKKIEFQTLYNKIYKINWNLKIFEKQFFSEKTIQLIHWMVKTRFTSYKKIFNLFLPTFEIEKLFKYKTWKLKKKNKQFLYIFPDLRTAYNITKNLENIYSSHNTTIQKIKLFWQIKNWKLENLWCTSSQIFQDRYNLEKITIYYPHKRYYKNQQDPRYDTFEVAKKMSQIYDSKLEVVNNLSI